MLPLRLAGAHDDDEAAIADLSGLRSRKERDFASMMIVENLMARFPAAGYQKTIPRIRQQFRNPICPIFGSIAKKATRAGSSGNRRYRHVDPSYPTPRLVGD
jgi:hypothetical protein